MSWKRWRICWSTICSGQPTRRWVRQGGVGQQPGCLGVGWQLGGPPEGLGTAGGVAELLCLSPAGLLAEFCAACLPVSLLPGCTLTPGG